MFKLTNHHTSDVNGLPTGNMRPGDSVTITEEQLTEAYGLAPGLFDGGVLTAEEETPVEPSKEETPAEEPARGGYVRKNVG